MSCSGNFNVISLNAQSRNAKFDSLLILLETARQQNITIHVMCIQESCLDENCDLSLYLIEGYTCISKGKRCSSHGGLMTYVNSQYNTSVIDVKNDSPIWESLFGTVKDMDIGKEFVVGNIYRPPNDNNNEQNVTIFVTELEPIIAALNDGNHELLIAGDFNINLLHINNCNKDHFDIFLDMLLGHSLFPKITFPTRLGENICSLIDNIFCSLSHNSVASLAGTICTRISDHFPCFLSLRLRNNEQLNNLTSLLNFGSIVTKLTRPFWPTSRSVISQPYLITLYMVIRTKIMINYTKSYPNWIANTYHGNSLNSINTVIRIIDGSLMESLNPSNIGISFTLILKMLVKTQYHMLNLKIDWVFIIRYSKKQYVKLNISTTIDNLKKVGQMSGRPGAL